MILIYTPHPNPRLTYITRFLFTSILGVPVSVTANVEEFKQYPLPKINYSNELLDGITIYPVSLLFEKDIHDLSPECTIFNGFPALFPLQQTSSLPFDPFAASFFMVSRYEEYLPNPIDQYNRVIPTNTVAFKNHFLEIPLVDHWALMLRQLIDSNYPDFQFPNRRYSFIPTIDVDIAYAYKYRGIYRTIGATLKSLLKGDIKDNRRRFQILFQKKSDPYDTFDLLNNWHQQHNLTPRFFFQVGRYGKYDKNLPATHFAMQHLIKQTSEYCSVGVHPSYQSNYRPDRIKEEIDTLSKITAMPIIRSRQHFLMLRFPETYQRLIKLGITEDYTMGYAQLPGFRAGTCTPFHFYDLTSETETSLMVYPFQVMDGTLNQYLKLSPLEAIERIRQLNSAVRKVNGTFISLWHNQSIGEVRNWKNWREVYKALLQISS